MHATLHQLLILRDQVSPDSELSAHVQGCAECRTELERLQKVTSTLRNLPPRWNAPDGWFDVQAGLVQGGKRLPYMQQRRPGWLLPAASAAAVVVAVLVTWQSDRGGQRTHVAKTSPVVAQTERVSAPVSQPETQQQPMQDSLVAESQRLEELLTVLPEEPRVTRAATALTVADLEDRIKWVDYRLLVANEAGIEPQESQQLWQERVDLLNSLVAVRYAQTGAMAF